MSVWLFLTVHWLWYRPKLFDDVSKHFFHLLLYECAIKLVIIFCWTYSSQTRPSLAFRSDTAVQASSASAANSETAFNLCSQISFAATFAASMAGTPRRTSDSSSKIIGHSLSLPSSIQWMSSMLLNDINETWKFAQMNSIDLAFVAIFSCSSIDGKRLIMITFVFITLIG